MRNSQRYKGRSQKQLQGFEYIKQEQSKRKVDYLSKKRNLKKSTRSKCKKVDLFKQEMELKQKNICRWNYYIVWKRI